MPKDDDAKRVDADSLEQLELVRKGKPRKFVMLCKGTSIISLVVYKKGSLEKYKKQAKELGTGQIFYGVVGGRGMDVTFQLARTDGFEKEPVKTPVLRTFLDESAGYKSKPLFEIVDVLGVVLDEDDPLVQRFLKLQADALTACDAHPDRAGEIGTLCRQIGGHFDEDQPDKALDKLTTLEDLLRNLGSGTSSSTTTEKTDDKAKQDWLAAHGRLEGPVAEILKAGLGDVTKIRGVWAFALEKAAAGDFNGALKAVPSLVQLVKDARSAGRPDAEKEIPAGLVPYVRARLKWSATRIQLREEIGRLQDAILAKLPSEVFGDMTPATLDLYDHIELLDEELETTLEKLVETPDGAERERLKSKAGGVVDRYRQALDSDFFRDVDTANGFTPVAVRAPAVAALEEVAAALA